MKSSRQLLWRCVKDPLVIEKTKPIMSPAQVETTEALTDTHMQTDDIQPSTIPSEQAQIKDSPTNQTSKETTKQDEKIQSSNIVEPRSVVEASSETVEQSDSKVQTQVDVSPIPSVSSSIESSNSVITQVPKDAAIHSSPIYSQDSNKSIKDRESRFSAALTGMRPGERRSFNEKDSLSDKENFVKIKVEDSDDSKKVLSDRNNRENGDKRNVKRKVLEELNENDIDVNNNSIKRACLNTLNTQ
jgi:hypothetical protein